MLTRLNHTASHHVGRVSGPCHAGAMGPALTMAGVVVVRNVDVVDVVVVGGGVVVDDDDDAEGGCVSVVRAAGRACG